MNAFEGPKSCRAGEDLGRGVRVKIDTANSNIVFNRRGGGWCR